MITAKQVYGTYPHVQMRWHIERTKPEATKAQKAAFLGQLVGKFVANCNAQHPEDDRVMGSVGTSFGWAETQEGHDYWAEINRALGMTDEFHEQWFLADGKKPKVVKLPPPAPKPKRVGWWA